MYATKIYKNTDLTDQIAVVSDLPLVLEAALAPEVTLLITHLSPEIPWGDRQSAARKLGQMRCQDAVPALLAALPKDPFWMVRCAIVQALQMIADPAAIPILEQASVSDSYQAVRSYAARAVEKLS